MQKKLKKEFINKLKLYVKSNKNTNITLKVFKSFCLNTFYKYRYNNNFNINPTQIHNHYYQILNEYFSQDWLIIKKNLFNLDNENIIKHIEKNYYQKII